MLLSSLKTLRVGQNRITVISESNKVVPCPPTLFGIYIDKLEDCLEKTCCVGPTLTSIVINLLLYANDIVLMARSPHDLENQIGRAHV